MSTMGYWLSQQEKVEVEAVIDAKTYQKYANPTFRVRRSDGTTRLVERRDIILQEEESLVDELAHILYHSINTGRHERYAEIMRYFLSHAVPYVGRLQAKKPLQMNQLMLNLHDAG